LSGRLPRGSAYTYQDCIPSDARMPGIDGIELLRRLGDKEIDWAGNCGHRSRRRSRDHRSHGRWCVYVLEKPYDDEALLDEIARALMSHRQ
jgi:FixJ family two-component response regulator